MMDPLVALEMIWDIVHVPTSKTAHKGAGDHFARDFDEIRRIIKPFIDAGYLTSAKRGPRVDWED